MEPRVSIITLGVEDLQRSYRFYKDGLGLPTTKTPEDGIIFFQTGGVCLALYPFDKLLRLNPRCTFLVGEKGSGKSTLLEGIADRWGFSKEGGPRTRNLYAQELWSELGQSLFINRKPGCNPMDGFFCEPRVNVESPSSSMIRSRSLM